ncbi:TRAD1 protein, partial [Eudromia elegans]|nr:TRAD1 protein [Eudromia elegans]
EQLVRNKCSNPSPSEEQTASLDYMLALSLQTETHPHGKNAAGTPSDCWKNCYSKEPVPSARLDDVDEANFSGNEIMLPCEFCEELYPAEDLILHQTGCNPASAFASFGKRSSSPKPRKYDDLHDFGPTSRRYRPQAVQAEGNIIIPCEFCGIQLEEEVLFHHQDQCDLRPEAASVAEPLPLQQRPASPESAERRDSPELARRRGRHQGA